MHSKLNEPNEPHDITQVYRWANEVADSSKDLDDRIEAYDKVINFCNGNEICRLDRSIKKNTLLYWAYNNVAEAYLQKKHPFEAIEHYNRSLVFASDGMERISTLNNLADIYEEMKNRHKWFEVKEKIIAELPFSERRAAYLRLIEKAGDNQTIAEILERALQMVTKEEIPLDLKCDHVLKICQRLQKIYQIEDEYDGLQRVNDLVIKTNSLIEKLAKKKA